MLRYASNGCKQVLLKEDASSHEDGNCTYRPLPCWLCKSSIPLALYSQHVRSSHSIVEERVGPGPHCITYLVKPEEKGKYVCMEDIWL